MNAYQQTIAASRYSRFLPEFGRRETWPETCTRYLKFWDEYITENLPQFRGEWFRSVRERVYHGVLNLEVMPSMRILMTAGPALLRDNVAGFNCSYRAVDELNAFPEIMYVLMCGTGAGFSVEQEAVSQLPQVAEVFCDVETTLIVKDSKLGWCGAFKQLLHLLVAGQVPRYDVSKVRPSGAPLKTFGGRASGPEPLIDLFDFTIQTFRNAAGRQLTDLECHDIVCKIAQIVVVGGVRRSALIGLSDLDSISIRGAKSGEWWIDNNQRALANNSAVYEEKPTPEQFAEEWDSLVKSGSGERGIFSRVACRQKFEEIGREYDPAHFYGTNPCGEILLRSAQFCNLTEVVVRPHDTELDLKNKVELATIMGTLQACLTDFRFLSSKWKKNSEEENLLGVSLTGIWDNPHTCTPGPALELLLSDLRSWAWGTNEALHCQYDLPLSAAITTVKPSGTVSQLVDSASGIHPRHASRYIRRIRSDKKDPISDFLIEQGVHHEEDVYNNSAWVFSFPITAPEDALTRDDVTAEEHLALWAIYRKHWTDHNPSVTITVKWDEWDAVGKWVYNNFDKVGGLSFLPYDGGTYQQAPYETVTDDNRELFNTLVKNTPTDIDWRGLAFHEKGYDSTEGTQELACTAGACSI